MWSVCFMFCVVFHAFLTENLKLMKYFIQPFKHMMCLLMEYTILFSPNIAFPDKF